MDSDAVNGSKSTREESRCSVTLCDFTDRATMIRVSLHIALDRNRRRSAAQTKYRGS